MEAPPSGGCDFPVDPDLEPPTAPVFWNPVDAPAVVSLMARLPSLGLSSVPLSIQIVDRRSDTHGVSWMRLADGSTLVGADGNIDTERIGILIPLDEHWPVRLAAADRLRRRMIETEVDPPLTQQRRDRLKRALRTVDGRRAGASYRAIATVLFGARRVADEPWKTSSLKAQVARLATYGRKLVERGHEDLLRGRLK